MEMAPEIIDLTDNSPPASPKSTPKRPTSPTSSAGSSSAPSVMQNHHQPQPSLEQQSHQLHSKRLRLSAEPSTDARNPDQPTPARPRLVRSYSDSNIPGLRKSPMFSSYQLHGTLSKVQRTETAYKILVRTGYLNPKRPMNCVTRASNSGSFPGTKSSEPRMIGPSAHVSGVNSPASAADMASPVTSGGLSQKMLLESAVQKQIAPVPTPLASFPRVQAPSLSDPPKTAPPTEALTVESSSMTDPFTVYPYILSSHMTASPMPVPTPTPVIPSPLAEVLLPHIPSILAEVHLSTATPVPTSHAMVPRAVLAPLVSAPFASALPMSSALVPAPAHLVWATPLPAYERMIPETLRLFPVEAPFFPLVSERASSSTAGNGDEEFELNLNLDLSL